MKLRMTSPSLSYRAGAASACITPDEALWLAGYASRAAPARGKISDLCASALALEDAAGERFVVVSVDLIAVTPIIAEPVFTAAQFRHGLSRRQILLAASHTHYGPEFRPDKQVFFHIPEPYAAKLPDVAAKVARAVIGVIDQAIARLEPVRLFVRRATVGFAHNRRRRGVKDGNPSREDIVDHDVPVLECINGVGARKAVVFGYACHNTTIPANDLRYCADWAGFARQQLHHDNPSATALFLPGAGADQDPEPHGSVKLSRRHGKDLADVVRGALEKRGVEITGPLHTELENVSLPLEPVTRQQLEVMLERDDPPQRVKARFLLDRLARGENQITSYSAPIQVIRFGDELILIALSGEPVVDWARTMKHGLWNTPHGVPFIWVAGYCNDMFGYLPTRRVQAEGGYEGGRATLWSWIPAPFTDDVEDKVTEAVKRLVARISSPTTQTRQQ